jgi:hypothetical protein
MLLALALAPLPPDTVSTGSSLGQVAGRLLALLGMLGIGGWAVTPIFFGRGKRTVRSFVWAADGTWLLERASGGWEAATLRAGTATLGPWTLLVWRTGGPGRRLPRYALIEVWETGRPVFRLLQSRLKLEAGGSRGQIGC